MSYKINTVYKAILAFAGAEPDTDGCIFQNFQGKKIPMVVREKPVVMAYDEHLKHPEGKIIFHPLAESAIRNESEVTEKLRRYINCRLNFVTMMVAKGLLQLVGSPDLHTRLTPEQSEIMYAIKEVDANSAVNLMKAALPNFKTIPDSYYLNIYLRRGGEYKGKKAHCVGVVVFPFYQKIDDDQQIKRVKDKQIFKDIMRFIFPDIDDKEAYNYGSYSSVAKYMDCLMNSAGNIAERLNKALKLYSEFIEDAESLMFSEDWLEYFGNVDALENDIRQIPMQAGNDGQAVQPPAAPTIPNISSVMQINQPVQQPVQQVQQTSKPSTGLTLSAVMGRQVQAQPNSPIPITMGVGGPPMNNPLLQQHYRQQQQQFPQQQPVYQQPVQQVVPGTVMDTPQGKFIFAANGQWMPVGGMPGAMGMPMQMPMQQGGGWGALRNNMPRI